MSGAGSPRPSSNGRSRRITVNLAPADSAEGGLGLRPPDRSGGPRGVAAASARRLAGHAAVGELALDGTLRPVPGALVAAEGARRNGSAGSSARPSPGPEVGPRRRRGRAGAPSRRGGRVLPGRARPPAAEPPTPAGRAAARPRTSPTCAARSVRGARSRSPRPAATTCCSRARPGSGKTMLARRLPGILPRARRRGCARGDADPLGGRVAAAGARAHSHAAVSGAAPHGLDRRDRRRRRPRRGPGEATLAHHGVLLLDELPEFPRPVLEALRQPLEDGTVAVARVGGPCVFPARFQLVGTMNLCPCGARGDPRVECTCSPQRLDRYPREALARAARPLRPRRALPRPRAVELAARPAKRRQPSASGSPRRASGCRRGARADARGRRSSRPRGRAAAALGSGPGARGSGRARRSPRSPAPRGRAGARGRGALLPAAPGAGGVSELALAAFAAESGEHLLGRTAPRALPRVRAALRRAGVPRAAAGTRRRVARPLDAASRAASRRSTIRRRGSSCAAARRSSCSTRRRSRWSAREPARLRRPRRADARPRARRGRARRRQRSRARHRRLGAPRRARGRRPTVAVLGCGIDRDYPRVARGARRPDRANRADRVGVRAGRRAGAVAVPGAQPHRRRPRAGDGRGRGARAERGADHRGPRARGGARGASPFPARSRRALSAGTNALLRARRDAAARGRRRAAVVRDRSAPSEPFRPACGDAATRTLAALDAGPAAADELVRGHRARRGCRRGGAHRAGARGARRGGRRGSTGGLPGRE